MLTISTGKFLRKRKVVRHAPMLRALWEKKAGNVVGVDISALNAYADVIVVCSGSSIRHTQTIADGLMEKAKAAGRAASVEGYGEGDWILIDLGDAVVHVFTEETRKLFDIEGLWHEAPLYRVTEDERTERDG